MFNGKKIQVYYTKYWTNDCLCSLCCQSKLKSKLRMWVSSLYIKNCVVGKTRRRQYPPARPISPFKNKSSCNILVFSPRPADHWHFLGLRSGHSVCFMWEPKVSSTSEPSDRRDNNEMDEKGHSAVTLTAGSRRHWLSLNHSSAQIVAPQAGAETCYVFARGVSALPKIPIIVW